MSVAASLWKYLSDNHDTVATLAAVVASLLAFIGLLVSAQALILQARSVDAINYLDILDRIAAAQRRIRDASDDPKRDFEWNEFLNLLESMAELYRLRRFGRAASRSARNYLIGSIVSIECEPAAKARLIAAKTHPSAFEHLLWFQKKHRQEIDRHVAERANVK